MLEPRAIWVSGARVDGSRNGRARVDARTGALQLWMPIVERATQSPTRPACGRLLAPRSLVVVGAGRGPARSATRCCAISWRAGSPAPSMPSTRTARSSASRGRVSADLADRAGPRHRSPCRPPRWRVLARAVERGVPRGVLLGAGFGEAGPDGPRAAGRGACHRPRPRHAPGRPELHRRPQHRSGQCGWTPPSPCSAAPARSAGPARPVRRLRRRAAHRGRRRRVWASRSSSRSATRPTSAATTCCSPGTPTRAPGHRGCTSSRSATRAASRASPGRCRAASRSSPSSPAVPRRAGAPAVAHRRRRLARGRDRRAVPRPAACCGCGPMQRTARRGPRAVRPAAAGRPAGRDRRQLRRSGDPRRRRRRPTPDSRSPTSTTRPARRCATLGVARPEPARPRRGRPVRTALAAVLRCAVRVARGRRGAHGVHRRRVTEGGEMRAAIAAAAARGQARTVAVEVGKPATTRAARRHAVRAAGLHLPGGGRLGPRRNAYRYAQLRSLPAAGSGPPAGRRRHRPRRWSRRPSLTGGRVAAPRRTSRSARAVRHAGLSAASSSELPTRRSAAAADFGYPVAIKFAQRRGAQDRVGRRPAGPGQRDDVRLAVAEMALRARPAGPTDDHRRDRADHRRGARATLRAARHARRGRRAHRHPRRPHLPLGPADGRRRRRDDRRPALRAAARRLPRRSRYPRPAMRDVLVRVAALVDDVPEIAELDINPIICRGRRPARRRCAHPRRPRRRYHPDPLVRQLRGPITTEPPAIAG